MNRDFAEDGCSSLMTTCDQNFLCFSPLQEFNCNGTVVENPEYGEVIQLQGDQRQNISDFLKQLKLAKPDQIHMHGF